MPVSRVDVDKNMVEQSSTSSFSSLVLFYKEDLNPTLGFTLSTPCLVCICILYLY